MANPQWEDGFTKIANEIMESLIRIRIPGEARQVLDAIIRMTYGYRRTWREISLSTFQAMTGLGKSHICRHIKSLLTMQIIITQKGNRNLISYRVQKDYIKWKPLPKKVTIAKPLPKKVTTITQKGNAPPIRASKDKGLQGPKENFKEKRIAGKNPAVKKIINFFYETTLKDKGFKPRINGKAGGSIIKQCLKDMEEDEIRNCIKYYINSAKAAEKGITLTAALSSHTINLYRQNWQKVKGLYE